MAAERGRPTLCTPELINQIVALLERGIPLATACEAVGVESRDPERWMQWAREGRPRYLPFLSAVTRARARGRVYLHDRAVEGGRGSAQALAILGRRDPEHYAPVQRVEMTANSNETVNRPEAAFRAALEELTTAELRRLIDQ